MSSQDLDNAIKSINDSAGRANTTTDFFNSVLDGSRTESVQNPLTGTVVPSVQKAVYDQYKHDVNQIHQDVVDANDAAARAEAAAGSADAKVLRSDLAAPGGSAIVGFKMAGANSVPRTSQEKMGETVSASDFTDLKAALAYAKLNRLTVNVSTPTTVRIPTDAATIQDAVTHMSSVGGIKITILVEAGHRPASGASVSNGDFGFFTITSEDPEITLSASFPVGGYFISGDNCIAPILGSIVNGVGVAGRAYSIFGSIGKILPNAGGRNLTGRGWYANTSILQAGLTKWYNIGDQMYASAGSAVQFGGSLIDGSTVTSNGALVASRGSRIEAQALTMRNCLRGLECKRASSGINAHNSTFENIGGFVARASRGGVISINGSTVTETVGAALEAFGGTISASEGVSITAKVGNTSTGVTASGGGNIDCTGITISGFGADNMEARDTGRISAASAVISGAGRHNLFGNQGGHISAHGSSITGAAVNDARVSDGGVIEIRAATTTSSQSAGTPNVIDTNVNGFGGFNVIASGGRGIIWG